MEAQTKNDLPSMDKMTKIICERENITPEQASKKINKERKDNHLLSKEIAAYYHLVKLGVSDEDIDNFEE